MNNFITTTSQNFNMMQTGMQMITCVESLQPRQFLDTFDRRPTDRNFELTSMNTMPGAAGLTAEGETAVLSGMKLFGIKTHRMKKYTISMKISVEMIQDNLYKETVPQYNRAFARSMIERMNIEAANVYRNGFNAAADAGFDNQALYANHRLEMGGTVLNTLNDEAPLSYSVLINLCSLGWQFRDSNGILTGDVATKNLMVHPTYLPYATTLLNSFYIPGQADHSVSAVNSMNLFPEGIKVNNYIPQQFYAIRTNKPGMIFWDRSPLEPGRVPDVSTYTTFMSAFRRFFFTFDDFRASLGARMSFAGLN